MTPTRRQGFHVEELIEAKSLQLKLVAGAEGLSRLVTSVELQKPALALAGHQQSLHPERIQVLGRSELSYLASLDETVVAARLKEICAAGPPCVVLTWGQAPTEAVEQACRAASVPVFSTPQSTADFIDNTKEFLVERLGPTATTHGVLVDVFGVGVLLLGKSGIGKSEVALDLVLRGHRLVADDIVEIRRSSSFVVVGSGPELIKHHLEIRGLGILNVKDLFGIAAVRDSKRIDLVVELEEWNELEEYDRLGVDEQSHRFLGVDVPLIQLPVRPGRNMSTIIEVAARNQLLKTRGHHSARQFQDRLVRAIADGRAAELRRGGVE
jgi:HPr kinase/phosphorylase